MKFIRGLFSFVLILLLTAGTAACLVSAIVKFRLTDSDYLSAALPSDSYCDEMKSHVDDSLSYIALLYGLDEEAVKGLVTKDAVKSYTVQWAKTFLSGAEAPSYDSSPFTVWYVSATGYSREAGLEFGEDCSEAVTACLSALTRSALTGSLHGLLSNEALLKTGSLFYMLLAFWMVLAILLPVIWSGEGARGLFRLAASGFCGSALVFLPLLRFTQKGYVAALNLSPSPLSTQLTGILNTLLLGSRNVSLWVFLLFALLLVFAAFLVTNPPKRRKKPVKST